MQLSTSDLDIFSNKINSKIIDLAEESIIEEIIKKDEINKFFVLEEKDFIDEKLLNDLLKKLELNQNEFQDLLKQEHNTF